MISIGQQIEEVELELNYRRDVYARLVSSGKMKQSMSDYRMDRMRAVLKTLQWLQQHESEVLDVVQQNQADQRARNLHEFGHE